VRAAEDGASPRVFDSKDFPAVDVAALPVPRYDLLGDRPYNRFQVRRWHLLTRASRCDCPAALMPEHNDHDRAEMFHCVFKATHRDGISAIPRASNYEEIPETLVENDFRRHATVRAT